jgi:hypothetical protein
MARTDTLGNFLTDVAEAIRTKEGTADKIKASDFDTRISNLSGGGSEDLTEEFETYENELEEQNITLNDIIRALKGKGTGSGSANINIFIQEDEPTSFEGIWFKTSQEIPKNVELASGLSGDTISLSEPYNVLPKGTILCAVGGYGDHVYIIGGTDDTGAAYKYNINTKTITNIPGPPIGVADSYYATVGEELYMFGGSVNQKQALKFNMRTETYTILTNSTTNLVNGFATAVGTDIHLIGSYNNRKLHMKYDTINNTYTTLTNLPYDSAYSRGYTVGTKIYVIGSQSSYRSYVYDTATNTYSNLADTPYVMFNHLCFGNEEYAFLIGTETSGSYRKYITRYDIAHNSFTSKFMTLPYDLYNGGLTYLNGIAYAVGGMSSTSLKHASILEMEHDTLNYSITDGVLLINSDTRAGFKTELYTSGETVNRLTYDLVDADIIVNSMIQNDIETYYGDGTQWIKFKN